MRTHLRRNGYLAVHIHHIDLIVGAQPHIFADIRRWRSARLLLETLQIGCDLRVVDPDFAGWGELDGTWPSIWSKRRGR